MVRLLALFLIALSGPVWAQQNKDIDSGNAYLPNCKAVLNPDNQRELFQQGRCEGAVRSLYHTAFLLGPKRFCPPDTMRDVHQMIRVIVQYLEANPKELHQNFQWLAMEALQRAWPCR